MQKDKDEGYRTRDKLQSIDTIEKEGKFQNRTQRIRRVKGCRCQGQNNPYNLLKFQILKKLMNHTNLFCNFITATRYKINTFSRKCLLCISHCTPKQKPNGSISTPAQILLPTPLPPAWAAHLPCTQRPAYRVAGTRQVQT